MITYDPSKPLISIHIPKTGGAGFRELLKVWFGDKLFMHYYDEKKNKLPQKFKLCPKICIHGHFNSKRGFGVTDYYPEVEQFITFLRDPFEILISRYFFVKKSERQRYAYRDGKLLKLTDNVNDFLKKEIRNFNYHPNILDYFPKTVNTGNYKSIINDFIFIGFTDAYKQSINRLSELLKLPEYDFGIINSSERYCEVDPELRIRFMETHPLEYKVYNYARQVFLDKAVTV